MKEKEKLGRNIRLWIGCSSLLLGFVFLFIPFIPVGYFFILLGLFFLSPIIPAARKFIEYLEKKDSKDRVKKAKLKTEELERKLK